MEYPFRTNKKEISDEVKTIRIIPGLIFRKSLAKCELWIAGRMCCGVIENSFIVELFSLELMFGGLNH
ncbi:hypothetical protein, partial [Salmonella bongori]|uniref:hypothetical protein n=1 Tax=Salmonella bongori TaxID=54736 RepID=UPI001C6681B7